MIEGYGLTLYDFAGELVRCRGHAWPFQHDIADLTLKRYLTHGNALLACVSGESVSAAAAVKAAEVPVTPTRAREEAQRPALAVV